MVDAGSPRRADVASPSVTDALALAEAHLRAGGVPEPRLDAELLLRHALGWDRARLLANPRHRLAPARLVRFLEMVEQRALRRPLQHITGRQEFWGRAFRVTPDVLIPRPETELVVEAALQRLTGAPAAAVDVGTGSGCIAISLAAERPAWDVRGIDLSEAALRVARDNARRLGVTNVRFDAGDLLDDLDVAPGSLDLVASNPPYVAAAALPTLQPEVSDHEPRLALTPPGDAASAYRRLAPRAAELLRPGGLLLVELGHGMAAEVTAVVQAAGLGVDDVRPDLAGIPRVLVARRP